MFEVTETKMAIIFMFNLACWIAALLAAVGVFVPFSMPALGILTLASTVINVVTHILVR